MNLKMACICLSILWMGIAVAGNLEISPGTIQMKAETAGQEFTVAVTGGGETAGMNLYLQIGGGTQGPVISKVDMVSGSIWGNSAENQVELGESSLRTVFHATVTPSETVAANGTVVTVTVDTTGVSGGKYQLALNYKGRFHSQILDANGDPLSLNLADGYLSVPYTLTYLAGPNGSIAGTSPQNVHHGAAGTAVTAVPGAGYHFVSWDDGVLTACRTDMNSTSDKTMTANFAINTYTLTYNAVENGSISGATLQTVNYKTDGTAVTAVPDPDCYFMGWSDGVKTLSRQDRNVTGDFAVTANFHANGTIVALKNGIAVKPLTIYAMGSVKTYQLTVPESQTLLAVTVSGGTGNCDVDVTDPSGTIVRKSIHTSNNEFFQIKNPADGKWSIHLYGVTDYSGISLMAKYSKATAVPAVPSISATDGKYEDRVVITWHAVLSATSYEIYRNTDPDKGTTGPNFTKLGEVTDLIFEDNTAERGKTYWYFAKAKNSYYDIKTKSIKDGVSNYSPVNSGYVAKKPALPGAVTASDGTYFNKIRVSWAKVVGATSYMVFRTNAELLPPVIGVDDPIGETTALFYDDFGGATAPRIGNKYFYWIAAKNTNGTTAVSKSNYGYLSRKGPAAVTASNGTYSKRIIVAWTAVPGATAYDVYRYADPKFATLDLAFDGDADGIVSVNSALEYEDTASLVANIPHYYKVRARYDNNGANYSSDLSTGAVGKTANAWNPTSDATIPDGGTSVGQNCDKGSSVYYAVEVPVGTARMVATLNGEPVGASNDCDLYAKVANFPTKASYGAKGVENLAAKTEILAVSNPAAGTWYFLLYGTTAYTSNVTLTVNCYAVQDIVLTSVPSNKLAVPLSLAFKGQVLDGGKTGIPNIVVQVRNPITGLTSSLAKTDKNGVFSYVTTISTEGEHTFDFFFTDIPDTAKGTASHTVATRKGCLVEAPNNFFDYSSYLPATPVSVPLHINVIGLQNFLNTRNGWNDDAIVGTYEDMWINSTLVKAKDDTQLDAKLDGGLYLLLYGVEGAGVGNDTSTTSALSAVPFVVHVETSKKGDVLAALNTLGVMDGPQKAAIEGGSIGIVAVTSLSDPDEGVIPVSISLLACEQLELLANLAAGAGSSSDGGTYSGVSARKVTITLANSRKISVVTATFVK